MNTNKSEYVIPKIEVIKIDNEISLSLESDAPFGPGESYNQIQIKQDPFKTESM